MSAGTSNAVRLGTTIRRLGPGDRARIEQAFSRLSPESRYWRYGRSEIEPRIALDWVAWLDGPCHLALGAFDSCGAAIGVARCVLVSPGLAEVAVTVVDGWQGRGVGRSLLEELARSAGARGIHELQAFVLAENRAAVQLMRGAGAEARSPRAAGLIEYRLRTPEPSRREQLHHLAGDELCLPAA